MKRFFALILILLLAAAPAMAVEELVYRTPDVELHLPASWIGKILILPTATGAAFYQKASYDRFMEEGLSNGGFLFSLGASADSSYEELPSYIDLGVSGQSSLHYFLELPTDYPAYMEDDIRGEWDAMHDAMRGIAQGTVVH